MINNPIIYKLFNDFTNHRKKTRRTFAVDLFPTLLNTGSTDETFQQSGKQDSFRHILKLVCMKVQAHSCLEPPLEYNQDHNTDRQITTENCAHLMKKK